MANILSTVDNALVSGTDVSDYLGNSGSNVTIQAYGGNDTVYSVVQYDNITVPIVKNNIIIDSGEGNDHIDYGYVNGLSINGGEGNNSIIVSSSSDVTVNASGGNDHIEVSGYNILIDAGNGNNTVSNNGGNHVTINTGSDADSVYAWGNNILVNAGDGDNFISESFGNGSSNITINTGQGNDTISTGGTNLIISAYAGNDYIMLSGMTQCNLSTINAGIGNDSIFIFMSSEVLVEGDDGDDYIVDSGSRTDNITINAGAGNDNVTLSTGYNLNAEGNMVQTNSSNFVVYTEGDGNDTLYNYSPNNTIKVNSSSTPYSVASGSDIIINVGSGSMRLVDAADKTINVIDTNGNMIFSENNSINSITSEITPNKTIPQAPTSEVIDTSTTVTPSTPSSGGDNYIQPTISGGANIVGTGTDEILNGTIGEKNDFVYNSGNVTIANYESGENIIFNGTYQNLAVDGNDFVVNAAEGSVRIRDARGKLMEFVDNNNNALLHVCMQKDDDTFNGTTYHEALAVIGANNASNQIYAGSGGSTLWGGAGRNSDGILIGGDGMDMFIYNYGNGNDEIFADEEDIVNFGNVNLGQIRGVNMKDNRTLFVFDDLGSLNVFGRAGTFILDGQTYNADYDNKQFKAVSDN